MKQYGTTHLKRTYCKCCVMMENPRARVKAETLKMIKEEQDEVVYLGNTVHKSDTNSYCGVCGDYENPDCATEC